MRKVCSLFLFFSENLISTGRGESSKGDGTVVVWSGGFLLNVVMLLNGCVKGMPIVLRLSV